MSEDQTIKIYVDADACPVKDEVYKVAFRYSIPVAIVANSYIRIPRDPLIELVVVNMDADAADDHIAEHADALSVVITADIPLADRCLKAGAIVLGANGKPFTDNSIGAALATRSIMVDLRAGGEIMGGPSAYSKADRSRFLSALDNALVKLQQV